MSPPFFGLCSRVLARVSASRFAKPGARVALVAMGLACLAAIGRAGVAGSVTPPVAAFAAAPSASGGAPAPPVVPSPTAPSPPAVPIVNSLSPTAAPVTSRGPASPDDPVVLNSAGLDDLRRLPGIGEKRATAILALRARLGRLRAIEDLMKVKGIGRATLKRLRPLVRLDGRGDAGQ
jgi:competence protein ComEA